MRGAGKGPKARPWTEAGLQRMLAMKFNRSGSLCVPNCGAFGWEADLLRVSPRLLCSEYEVKVTRGDFRHDAGKALKHIRLAEPGGRAAPNYFWYVAPAGVVPLEDVPEHAGLIEVVGPGLVSRKRAPRLHSGKIELRQLLWITRGSALRYWQQLESIK